MLRLCAAWATLLIAGAPCWGADDALDPPQPVAGMRAYTVAAAGDTLVDLAYRYRVGFDALARLNPEVPIWIPEAGTRILLPSQYVLPRADPEGLVVNVPEMRLYDYTEGGMPRGVALAIGHRDAPTPVGDFVVGAKRRDPIWYVPPSIRRERPEIAPAIPPGPDNPLGSRWITIGETYYGLHGTNLPWSVGRATTHGCLRLYDDQMQDLYARVASGVRLQLVYESVKLGRDRRGLVVEVHADVYGREPDRMARVWARLLALGVMERIDRRRLAQAIQEQLGTPVPIERAPLVPPGVPSP